VLAAEVPVQRRWADGHRFGDVGHRHLGVALRDEQISRRGDDELAPITRTRPPWRRRNRARPLGAHQSHLSNDIAAPSPALRAYLVAQPVLENLAGRVARDV